VSLPPSCVCVSLSQCLCVSQVLYVCLFTCHQQFVLIWYLLIFGRESSLGVEHTFYFQLV